jgi:hypothetical protein
MAWSAALPYIVQYGVPAVAYAIGHVTGWFHHKRLYQTRN